LRPSRALLLNGQVSAILELAGSPYPIHPYLIFSVARADAMSEVTCILSAIAGGDPSAAEQLLPLGYDE
jgi:hypothetical protein